MTRCLGRPQLSICIPVFTTCIDGLLGWDWVDHSLSPITGTAELPNNDFANSAALATN